MISSQSVEQSRPELLPQWLRDLTEGRFAAVEASLQALLDASDADSEETLGNHCATLQAFAGQFDDYATLLPRWRLQYPQSLWPDLVACLLWERAANQARGEQLADEVADERWQRAFLAQHALFIQAMDLLHRHSMPWVLAMVLMRNVMVFNEPDWLLGWLDGQVPFDELALVQQAAAQAWPRLGRLPALPAAPAVTLAEALRGHARSEEEPEGFFWLLQALQAAPNGAYPLQIYAQLRTPRWGGSHEEILWLADSPMAARLDEAQRNALRLVAWLDTIDADNVDAEDDDQLEAAWLRGQDIFGRPLGVLARAQVLVKLAELAGLSGRHAQAQACYSQALSEVPTLKVSADVLYRMLSVGVATGMGEWLGHFACNSRLQSAFGSVLYGLLCDTGWCAVQRDPAIAEGWYRHALSYGPMPQPEGECPFNDVYYAFDEGLQATALRHMVECAAALGVPEMQFALAYLHEDSAPAVAVHWYRQAGAHGFGRALYNLSVVCDQGVEQGGLDGYDVQALRELGNECEVTCLALLLDQQQLTERELDRVPNCFIGLSNYLLEHKVDSERVRRNVAVIEAYAQRGWPEAMRIVARHYRAEDCPQGHDYPQAVYWCEQACRLEPDDEQNIRLRESLSAGLMGGMRYRRALAKAEAGNLSS
ncbi:DUF4034 domain-containing protein [Pseudomonas sp. S31]|uniref:DUF4034 domain-containing protein n=1 Tax=Pseudomonas sp. S31 TaxID=1564473 RepID=UPI00191465CF|nr:DUF4034 domain-containing protein [Pseudomonas sp. S31]MBK4999355.1 DUF4034 domain-containing protein [Pseudomonas sp. S31]